MNTPTNASPVIYNAHPRLLKNLEDFFKTIKHAIDLKCNSIYINPFQTPTETSKEFNNEETLSRSIYAIKNHFEIAEYLLDNGSQEETINALKDVLEEAKKIGIQHIFADLVFNHVAIDHPLVEKETSEIQDIKDKYGVSDYLYENDELVGFKYNKNKKEEIFYFKFKRNHDLSIKIGGPAEDPWKDVAEINYSSPEGYKFFVTGDTDNPETKGYWKQVIDWHIGLGFNAFRCDVAFKVPPKAWVELISYAHKEYKNENPQAKDKVLFLAETLGGSEAQQGINDMVNINITENGKKRKGFDYTYLCHYWWDLTSDWLSNFEVNRANNISKLGGVGHAENHDTKMVFGDCLKPFNGDVEKAAKVWLRDYTVATLISSASMMQMGNEYGKISPNGVFQEQCSHEDMEELRKSPNVNLEKEIAQINKIKAELGVGNCRAEFNKCSFVQDKLIEMDIKFTDVDTNEVTATVNLLVNQKPECGAIRVHNQGLLDKYGDKLKTAEISSVFAKVSKVISPEKEDVKTYNISLQEKEKLALVA